MFFFAPYFFGRFAQFDKIVVFFIDVNYYSETYHESTQYEPHGSGDPIVLHWENQLLPDFRFEGCQRFPLTASKCILHSPVFADGLPSVAVFAVVFDDDVPAGVYYFDVRSQELVRVGDKNAALSVCSAFPESDLLKQSQAMFVYCGVMAQNVWRFKEAAYRRVQIDVGAACANTMLFAKSQGKKVFPLGGFVDDSVAVALKLPSAVIPLAALVQFPENSMVAFNSEDDGFGEFAYSNRNEEPVVSADPLMAESNARYPSRFMLQNRCECINDLSKCVKVRRVSSSALPGDEFPLTPAKFSNEYYMREMWYLSSQENLARPFVRRTVDLDDFSTMLRWLEMGPVTAFGGGLLKIWVVVFDVMFVYSGVYRYVPFRKSIYMQASEVNAKKFTKCFAVPEQAANASFALFVTADLKEACGVLGERAYRYLNLNAGFLLESLNMACRFLNKDSFVDHYVYQDELKKLCFVPEGESLLACALVGKCK